MKNLLKETRLLDFQSPEIRTLIENRGWDKLDDFKKIEASYNFVKDEILFAYNATDYMTASEVLKEGFGQCNTKSILFMALLRALGIPCRLHGFTIDKKLKKGVIKGLWFHLAPQEIIHTWVELFFEDQWYEMEGIIIDKGYLQSIQEQNRDSQTFCAYGIADKNLQNPQVYWNRSSTYIQKEALLKDLGVFDDPDRFFGEYSQALGPVKQFIFGNITARSINRNVGRIRGL